MSETREALRDPRRVVMFSYAGAIAALTGVQLMSPALPAIRDALGLSDSEIAWFTSLFLLPGVFFAIPMGMVADRWGRRIPFCGSLVAMGLGGILLFVVHDPVVMFTGRLLQGIAFATLLPMSITIIGDVTQGAATVRALGYRSVAIASSEVVQPLIGGALVGLAWFAPFAVQVVALPLAVVGWFLLGPDGGGGRMPVRLRDLASLMASRLALALQLAGFLRFMFKFSVWGYLPILLAARDLSPFVISTVLSVLSLSNVIAAWSAERTVRRVGVLPVAWSCLVAIAVAYVGIATSETLTVVFVGAVLLGWTDGLYGVTQDAVMTVAVPGHARASFVAATGTVRNLGKFAGPAVSGVLLLVMSLEWVYVTFGLVALAAIPATIPLRAADAQLRGS